MKRRPPKLPRYTELMRPDGTWHTLEIHAANGAMRAWVDGKECQPETCWHVEPTEDDV